MFRYDCSWPPIEEYVLPATKRQAAEDYRHAERGWAFEVYGPHDTLEFTRLGVELTVAALYRRTEVPAETAEPEGEV